jgi:hypothetical protein
MCNHVPQPPLADLKNIVDYGCVSGGADCTTAILNACKAAGSPQSGGPAAQTSGIYIPAGTFNANQFNYNTTPLNCNIYGQGFTSEIYSSPCTVHGSNCQMYSTGDNSVWSNFQHNAPLNARDASNFNLARNGGTNNMIEGVLVIGGNGAGIANFDSYAINTNNGVFNTGADCNLHETNTQFDIVDHTYVSGCGDDDISSFGYSGDTTPGTNVQGTLAQWNTLINGVTSRCVLESGFNETTQDNYCANNSEASGLLVATENSGGDVQPSIYNNIMQYNDIVNASGSNYQCSIMVNTNINTITNTLIQGNIISDSANRNGICVYIYAGGISDLSLLNNTVNTGGTGMNTIGSPTNITCSGNTQNGSALGPNPPCTGSNPDTATGSPLSYYGCVVGTAVQYPNAPVSSAGISTIKAVAVRPGFTNSAVASSSTGPAAAAPTFSPASGTTFSGGTLSVTLSSTTPSPTIYYYTSSPASSIITSVGPTFTDTAGNIWSLVGTLGASSGQMAINGQAVTNTSYVTEMVYINGNIWQENIANNWYEVTGITGTPPSQTVTFGSATTTSPIPAYSTYTGPISLSASSSITAYATASGYSSSPTSYATYTDVPLTSCSQSNSGSLSSINIGQYVQQTVSCYYASTGQTLNCSTSPDTYGHVVTAWGTLSGGAITIGAVGAGTTCSSSGQGAGCVKGIAAGSQSSTATVTGGFSCANYPFTVTSSAPTLNSATMVVQSGGTSVATGSQVTMCVNLGYVTPTESTQVCGNGTDTYGTVVSGFTSSSPSNATIVGSTGVLTGVAVGSTTVSASVNSGAYTPSLAVSVVSPGNVPPFAIQGPSSLQGAVTIP